MKSPRKSHRRRFLRSTAAALVGTWNAPYIVSSTALGGNALPPASERIALAFIGPGNRGRGLLKEFAPRAEVEVLAVADVSAGQRQRALQLVHELVDPVKPGSAGRCQGYADFREVLDRPDVDAVVVAAPEHWRAIMCIMAAKAGKDIYTEKPFSLTIKEGRAMVQAVQRYGRVFQHGTQRRAWDSIRLACERARSGRIGKVTHAVAWVGPGPETDAPNHPPRGQPPAPDVFDWDLWLGPAPWRPYFGSAGVPGWQRYRDYGIRSIANWGSHTLDHGQWALGKDDEGPVEILPPADGDPRTALKYADGVVFYRYPTPGDSSNVAVFGTEGRLRILGNPPIKEEFDPTPIGPDDVHLYRCENGDFGRDWLNCIRSRDKPLCNEVVGYRSGSLCQLIAISDRLRRPLKYDPDRVEFPGDEEANRLLDYPKRAPWRIY
jgi:predicted dehydrogenase